jgi:hypothetical protein
MRRCWNLLGLPLQVSIGPLASLHIYVPTFVGSVSERTNQLMAKENEIAVVTEMLCLVPLAHHLLRNF